MKSLIHRTAILPIIFVAISAVVLGQKPNRNDPNAWWVNIADAPVIFDFKPIKNVLLEDMYKRRYWFGLKNRSSKAVTDYSIGCVGRDGRNYKVVKRFYANTITDGGYGPNSFWHFNPDDPTKDETSGQRLCKDLKVAIVKVGFMDGSSWSLPGALLVKPSL
jgi:hypothetical protein